MWPSLSRMGSIEVTCTPPGRTVSRASMARVQEKAFWSKSLLRACARLSNCALSGWLHQVHRYSGARRESGRFGRRASGRGRGLLRLLVEERASPTPKRIAEHSQHGHGDAQPLDGRPQIGEGAGGEIECDAHRLARSRQRACNAGKTGLRQRCRRSGFRAAASSSTMVSSGSPSEFDKSSQTPQPSGFRRSAVAVDGLPACPHSRQRPRQCCAESR